MESSLKTLFITGSSGFIGSNAVRFFKDKYNIMAPTHHELDLLSQTDVNDYFKNNQIDFVLHTANVGGNRTAKDGPDIVEKNIRMFFNLAENQENFEKMIHLGSGAEYSRENMPPLVKEEEFGKFIPSDYYGFSKYIISKYIEKNNNICCLRLFGVFGPGEDYRYKFISNAILKNILKMEITIMQNVHFDWLYIDDLMNIINHFIKKDFSENTYNVATGKATDLINIANIINKNSNFESEVLVLNEGLNTEYSASNSKLINQIGNYAFKDMEESIKDLIKYYKSNLKNINCNIIFEDPYAVNCKINKEN